MITLIPALRDYLKADLVGTGKPVKLIEHRPPGWVAANLNARNLPAIFISSAGETVQTLPLDVNNTATQILRIRLLIMFQSTDPDVSSFHASKSPFAIYDAVRTLLFNNKQVSGTVIRLELPLSATDFDISERDDRGHLRLYGIGREMIVTYHRNYLPFHGAINNESQF